MSETPTALVAGKLQTSVVKNVYLLIVSDAKMSLI